ncbi:MAG TPA: hypothetical protein VE994_09890 [Terriglobales bacterium]|nr:hypothetical protein [Terriglobales bacterium]
MPRKDEPREDSLNELTGAESRAQLSLHASANGWSKALPRFLRRMEWTAEQWEEVRKHWLETPDDLTKRDWLLWTTAKMERYKEAPKLAIERQKNLNSNEWITAFLLARDWEREGIASFLLVDVDYVDKLIRAIKNKADVDTQGGIVRWFLGL